MAHLPEIELSAAEIMILTDLIYEQAPRLWSDGEWYCPVLLEWDSMALIQSYYDCARNDEAAAESLTRSKPLAKEQCSEQDYQRHAQLVDGSDSRSRPDLQGTKIAQP